MDGGRSAFSPNRELPQGYKVLPGGNSGCVLSPAPKLGLSAYQSPQPGSTSSFGGSSAADGKLIQMPKPVVKPPTSMSKTELQAFTKKG